MSNHHLNDLINISLGIIAVFSIGGEIAEKTSIRQFGNIKLRLIIIGGCFACIFWATNKKDDQSSEENKQMIASLNERNANKIGKLVTEGTDSAMNAKMETLFQSLSKLLGKDSAKSIITKTFQFNPPSLFIDVTLLPSPTLKPQFLYTVTALNSTAYDIDIWQNYISQLRDNYTRPNAPNDYFRIPRGHTIGLGSSFSFEDTIFSTIPKDKYYFLFKGTFKDAISNPHNFVSLLCYDMTSRTSAQITSPLQEQIFAVFRNFGIHI